MSKTELEKYHQWSRIIAKKFFYQHIAIYVLINMLLAIINYIVSPNDIWCYWVTISWGIGLVSHGLNTFGFLHTYWLFDQKWEDKQLNGLKKSKARAKA